MSTYIVVVDDEPDVESMFRQQFRRDLRSGRFVMEFALSAPAALEQVKAIPDPSLILILSDINMPGMSGLEMLPKVKAERPSVPVIMITAYGDDATIKRATELGAAGLLAKPIDFVSCCVLKSTSVWKGRRRSPSGARNGPERIPPTMSVLKGRADLPVARADFCSLTHIRHLAVRVSVPGREPGVSSLLGAGE